MNKQKLIYVEDLEEALYDEPCDVCDGQNDNGGYWGFSIDTLDKIIKILPTVDAEPVVHAHWEWTGIETAYCCSACHKHPICGILSNYCPNCGAKMDEVNN